MTLLSYFKCVDGQWTRDNSGQLGILLFTERGRDFHPIATDKLDNLTSADWFKSFTCQFDNASCTFSKEFRKSGDTTKGYWYASKKINGKLRRVYFGAKPFTKESLEQTLAKFSESKSDVVTQEVTQFVNDFSVGDKVTYATHDLPYKEKCGIGEVAEKRDGKLFIYWQNNPKMLCPFNIKSKDKLVLVAGHAKSDRHIQPSITEKILEENQKQIESLKAENALLANSLRSEKENYLRLKDTLERQADLIKTLRDDVFRLECELSKREDDIQGYAFMYEEHSNKIFAYQSLIEKYRALASGKTKKDNPRFAYLIDFLGEIDKLC